MTEFTRVWVCTWLYAKVLGFHRMFVTSDTLVKIDTICDCIGIFIFSFWEEGNLEGDFGEGDWNGGTPLSPYYSCTQHSPGVKLLLMCHFYGYRVGMCTRQAFIQKPHIPPYTYTNQWLPVTGLCDISCLKAKALPNMESKKTQEVTDSGWFSFHFQTGPFADLRYTYTCIHVYVHISTQP